MGIFSRVRDIISSNINSMLDKAEDPEKLVKLMIQEMEDTLVEVKASCAGTMAQKTKVQRAIDDAAHREKKWADKAALAVSKGREDLAREALLEKKRASIRVETLEKEIALLESLVDQYQGDIMKLEDKLNKAREKRRILVQRHIHAQRKIRAENGIRKVQTSEAMTRFDNFENRIDRMEASADLINYGAKPTLEEKFAALAEDEEIEKELEELKASQKKG